MLKRSDLALWGPHTFARVSTWLLALRRIRDLLCDIDPSLLEETLLQLGPQVRWIMLKDWLRFSRINLSLTRKLCKIFCV